jgi:hypothetical protein
MVKVTEFQAEQLRIFQPEILPVNHSPALIFGSPSVGSGIFEVSHHHVYLI